VIATLPPHPPARVQVVATEYRLALSRLSVRFGSVIVELVNSGQDPHDLALRRSASGAAVRRIGKLRPGGVADRTFRLAPGRYTLWCTLPGHRRRGMVATLVVRR
jgi:plastocyanin